jgi:hypothetical protein
MKSAELLVKGEALSYNQEDIPKIRKEILGIMYANMKPGEGWEE